MNTEYLYNSIDGVGSALPHAGKYLILTDDGVPGEYAGRIARQLGNATVFTVPGGEETKSLGTVSSVLEEMLKCELDRSDGLIAVGGGMVTDLGGFSAAVYKRGIPFYAVPTTLLAMCDAAVGGKTGVNLSGVKNAAGSFYPAEKVFIDTTLLETLPPRIFSEGMGEVVKMAVTLDRELFEVLEKTENIKEILPGIVRRAVEQKLSVTEQDPFEKGVRRVLNFGHTFGHALESHFAGKMLHGECVALGMLPMADADVRERIRNVLQKFGLPVTLSEKVPFEAIQPCLSQDKKREGQYVHAVLCHEAGSFEIASVTDAELRKYWENGALSERL